MSFAGLVSIAIVLSDNGDVLEDPSVTLLGVAGGRCRGRRRFARSSKRRSTTRSTRLPKPRRRDAETVREAVRRAVRGEIDAAWGKKPQTIVHVVHVSD